MLHVQLEMKAALCGVVFDVGFEKDKGVIISSFVWEGNLGQKKSWPFRKLLGNMF